MNPLRPFSPLILFILVMAIWVFLGNGEVWTQTNANSFMLTANSTETCCYSLSYTYGQARNVDRLEVELVQTAARFSAVQYPLTSDWRLSTLNRDQHLRWTYQSGEIPAGQQDLFDFCLESWNTQDSITLLVHWYATNTRLQTDTLRMGCTRCWQPEQDNLNCNADQSYTYTFNYRNTSDFTVDFLSIYEPAGQDFIAQETIPLSAPLAPGGSTLPIALTIDATAGLGEELCFGLTPRQYRQDTIAIACCSATYCLPLPDCDTCCTAYSDYVADVNAGFQIIDDCERGTLRLQANALNACDRVRYLVTGLGGGIVDGNEIFQIGGLTEGESYRVCMRVTRQSVQGEDCYEETDLEICQAYTFNCCADPERVDLDLNCPTTYDPLCACDGQTYLNSCTALNWGGIFNNSWTEGHCDSLNNCDIIVDVRDTLGGRIVVEWMNTRPDPIRYYLVQRRAVPAPPNPPGPWITQGGPLSAMATTYLDNMPLSPVGEYRVLAVTESGTLIYGEQDPDCIKGIATSTILEGGRIWPNPARDWLEVELPVATRAELHVYNLLGQHLRSIETDRWGRLRLPTSVWPVGTYWLVWRVRPGRIWRKAFVIQP